MNKISNKINILLMLIMSLVILLTGVTFVYIDQEQFQSQSPTVVSASSVADTPNIQLPSGASSWDDVFVTETVNNVINIKGVDNNFKNITELVITLTDTTSEVKICKQAFSNLTNLKTVVFALENTTTLDSELFQGCNNIEIVYFNSPNTTAIVEYKDNFCYTLISHSDPFEFNTNNNGWTLVIGDQIEVIPDCIFYSSDVKEIIIHEDNDCLKKIGHSAFSNCNLLTKIDLSDSGIISMMIGVFKECISLEEIVLPESLNYLWGFSFKNTAISTITIPKNLKEISPRAFEGMDNLTTINFNATNCSGVVDANEEELAFNWQTYPIDEKSITINIAEDVTRIPNYVFCRLRLFYKNGNNDNYTPLISAVNFLGNSKCTEIGILAFWNSIISTAKISIPASVTTISYGAFAGNNDNNDFSLTILGSVTLGTRQSIPTLVYKHYYETLEVEYLYVPYEDLSLYESVANYTNTNNVKNLLTYNTPHSYDITFKYNDDVTSDFTKTLNSGDTTTYTIANPARNGYTFAGWYLDQSLTQLSGLSSTNDGYNYSLSDFTGSTTLYAKWQPIPYNITYNLNGGTNANTNPRSYTINDADITLGEATKDGYKFLGWFKSGTDTEVTVIDTSLMQTYNLEAKWQPIPYNINYNLNGGTNANTNPSSYTINDADITLGEATKDGYKFLGWFRSGTDTKVTVIDTSLMQTYNLEARWEENIIVPPSEEDNNEQPTQDEDKDQGVWVIFVVIGSIVVITGAGVATVFVIRHKKKKNDSSVILGAGASSRLYESQLEKRNSKKEAGKFLSSSSVIEKNTIYTKDDSSQTTNNDTGYNSNNVYNNDDSYNNSKNDIVVHNNNYDEIYRDYDSNPHVIPKEDTNGSNDQNKTDGQ